MEQCKNLLNELLKKWEEDSKIDPLKPGDELLKIPNLHSKYLRVLSSFKIKLKKSEIRLKELRKEKWEYYTGKTDERVLKEKNLEPFPYILKSEVGMYLDSDSEITGELNRKIIYEEIVDICTAIIKELNSRTFQLKAFIDYNKFLSGN